MKFKIKNAIVKKVYKTEYGDFINRDALLEDEFGDLVCLSMPRKIQLKKGDVIDYAIGEISTNGTEIEDKNGNVRVYNNARLINVREGAGSKEADDGDEDDAPKSKKRGRPTAQKAKAKAPKVIDEDEDEEEEDEDEDLFN